MLRGEIGGTARGGPTMRRKDRNQPLSSRCVSRDWRDSFARSASRCKEEEEEKEEDEDEVKKMAESSARGLSFQY